MTNPNHTSKGTWLLILLGLLGLAFALAFGHQHGDEETQAAIHKALGLPTPTFLQEIGLQ
jgi:hypothetical protein